MGEPNFYEIEKEDEKNEKEERRFFLRNLHLILFWLLFDKIKEIIK